MTPDSDDRERYPLATIWDIVPLFESLDAIAIAQPTPRQPAGGGALCAGRRALPEPRPAPGARLLALPGRPRSGHRDVVRRQRLVGPGVRQRLPRDRHAALAAPTPNGRSRYIAAAGWDPQGGGIWWNTEHPYKAGEALASDTLLATLLYQQTHSRLRPRPGAASSCAWAQHRPASAPPTACTPAATSTQPRSTTSRRPLIYAQALLCRLTGERGRLRTRRAAAGHRAQPLRLPARLRPAVRRDLPAVDARAVLARPRPGPVRARRRQRPRRPGARAERRRAVPALLERRNAAPPQTPCRGCCRPRRRPPACSRGWRSTPPPS